MKQPSKDLIQYVGDEILRVSQELQKYSEQYAEKALDVENKMLYIDEMIEEIAQRSQLAAENIIRKVRLAEKKSKKESVK